MKLKLITLALLTLWIPVSIDKWINFEIFQNGLIRQPFSDQLGQVLSYLLPVVETATIILLVVEKWRKAGMLLSTALMAVFTCYIGLALLGAWDKLPCGCGSVISQLTWKQHFFFNLAFLLLSAYGLLNLHRSGAAGGKTA
ncbi:MauE/DoxX family redox-associated membrane protein [Leadbetterella byssophila]|uniref:MauE/DoxX family redox-associated membrane protein n=1 Tax=Leadbetterella byssophila TaxID=316068 RepID=UPI0039A04FC6